MKKKKSIATVIFCSLLLSGCAGSSLQTKYRPWGLTGGYKDRSVGVNHWRVNAGVNGVSDEGSAQYIAVYRAAEIVKAAGFSHMQIVNQKSTQEYFSVGIGYAGPPTNRGGGDTMIEVIGSNSSEPPSVCLAPDPQACFTISVIDAQERTRPFLRF